MAKKAKPVKETKTSKARFEFGIHISTRSLVIDLDGVAWWVDPDQQTITKAQ